MSTAVAPPPTEQHAAAPRARRKLTRFVKPLAAAPKAIFAGPWSNPKHRLLIILVSFGTLSFLAMLWFVAHERVKPIPEPEKPNIKLRDALAALDRGAYRESLRLLDELEEHDLLTDDDFGGPDLIRGILLAQDAERMWDRDQIRMARQASRYLVSAKQKGIPWDYQGPALYWLCATYVQAGNAAAARTELEQAIETNKELGRTSELHRLGMLAWLAEPEPDLKKALDYNTSYLEHDDLAITPRQEGLLMRARILFRMGQGEECREILRKLRSDTTAALEGLLLAAELQITNARAEPELNDTAQSLYKDAIRILDEAYARGNGREKIQRQALYLKGVCRRELGQRQQAWETFQRTRTAYPTSPEGITAAFAEATLARELGLHEDVVPTLIEGINAAGHADEYHNPLFPWSAVREQLMATYREEFDKKNFAAAIDLARVSSAMLTPETANELLAQARIAWADEMLIDLESQSQTAGDLARKKSSELYREAGHDYEELAKLHFSDAHYLDHVWSSAEYYFLGKDYAAALRQLREYLRYEQRSRRPLALLRYGECQVLLGRYEEALTTLRECIADYPRDASCYRARLLAARALLDKGDRAAVKELYLLNLESGQLTPASTEWRDALFGLGRLLFGDAQLVESQNPPDASSAVVTPAEQQAQELYHEAIRRLEEAVERYPNAPQAVPSRYLVAEAYRALAAYPRKRLNASSIQTARDEYAKELRGLLAAAMNDYVLVQESLANRREDQPLTTVEYSLLRNCYFAQAATLYELDRFQEAIGVYTTMINRYQSEPQVLDAYFQLATCQRKVGQLEEAQATLDQAKLALERLQRESSNFVSTTNHDAAEWQRILDWMGKL